MNTQLHQAIKDGYLSPIKGTKMILELDIHGSRNVSNGDYAVGLVQQILI